jgi:hypothetical protein
MGPNDASHPKRPPPPAAPPPQEPGTFRLCPGCGRPSIAAAERRSQPAACPQCGRPFVAGPARPWRHFARLNLSRARYLTYGAGLVALLLFLGLACCWALHPFHPDTPTFQGRLPAKLRGVGGWSDVVGEWQGHRHRYHASARAGALEFRTHASPRGPFGGVLVPRVTVHDDAHRRRFLIDYGGRDHSLAGLSAEQWDEKEKRAGHYFPTEGEKAVVLTLANEFAVAVRESGR